MRDQKNLHYIPDTQPHQGHAPRCSQPLSTNQTPHPTTKAGRQPKPPPNGESRHRHSNEHQSAGLLSQSPIVCLAVPSPAFDHSKPVPAQRLFL